MKDWILGLLILFGVFGVGLVLLRLVVARILKTVRGAGDALATGGVSLFYEKGARVSSEDDVRLGAHSSRRRTGLLLDALATGGLVLFVDDRATTRGKTDANQGPPPIRGGS